MAQTDTYNLQRFIQAQNNQHTYATALSEIRNGKKRSHWIWYVLPQLRGLGHSYNSRYYGISGADEARAYLADEVLSARLREVCEALLQVVDADCSVSSVMGPIDTAKTRSCLTLFDAVCPGDVFGHCLEHCFSGNPDRETLRRLNLAGE